MPAIQEGNEGGEHQIKQCHAQFIYGLNETGQSIIFLEGQGVSSLAGVVSPAGVGVLIFFLEGRQRCERPFLFNHHIDELLPLYFETQLLKPNSFCIG